MKHYKSKEYKAGLQKLFPRMATSEEQDNIKEDKDKLFSFQDNIKDNKTSYFHFIHINSKELLGHT
jgi:hypothetical protein